MSGTEYLGIFLNIIDDFSQIMRAEKYIVCTTLTLLTPGEEVSYRSHFEAL